MAGRPWTPEEEQRAAEMRRAGRSSREIGRELNRTRPSVEQKLSNLNIAPAPQTGVHVSATDDSQAITVRSHTIRTLDAALEAAEVDTDIWEVDKWTANKWDQGAVVGGRDDRKMAAMELWQVKVWLRRKVRRNLEDALEALLTRIGKSAPKYPSLPKRKISQPVCVEMCLSDAHFGKLCWGPETGHDYDLKIAAKVYQNAIEDLLASCKLQNVDQFLLPVGNDFFHVDNWRNQTTAGTQMDVDTRLPKIVEQGVASIHHAIDLMAGLAPVHVVWVPGNHDYHTSYFLCRELQAYYRQARHVSFDIGASKFKYFRYGQTLLGLTHGDMPKARIRDLPAIMAKERRQDWAATAHHEWHLGHYHHRAVDTVVDVPIRIIPCLSGTDAWHFNQGLMGLRAAEAYLWDRETAYLGHFSANVREN
jgi:hypothetical protein